MMIKFLNSKLMTVGLVVLVAFLGYSLLKLWFPLADVSQQASLLQQKLDDAKQQTTQLQSQQDYYQSDAYLEHELRAKLNYKSPDENLVLVYHDSTPATGQANSTSVATQSDFQKWFDYLFSFSK